MKINKMNKIKMNKIKKINNRTVIGIVCILVALALTFGVAPLVNRASDMKIDIVRVVDEISAGQQITSNDLEIVSVGAYNLPDNVIKTPEDIINQYAKSNIYAGDYITAEKITAEKNSADDIFNSLNGNKVAISVSAGSFSQSLSNKLQNGDIVSVIVIDKETGQSVVPPSLQYMQVITTTTDEGIDQDENLDEIKATTITFLVTPEQANLLSYYDTTTSLHFSLVYRGETDKAAEFIKIQDDYLEKQINTESENE